MCLWFLQHFDVILKCEGVVHLEPHSHKNVEEKEDKKQEAVKERKNKETEKVRTTVKTFEETLVN